MKKILMYFSIFFMVGTIVTVLLLSYIDDYIYKVNNTTLDIKTGESTTLASDTETEEKTIENIVIPDNAQNVEFSFDNKYYTYLLDNKIYIHKISDGEEVTEISEELPICYYKLLYDKNRIMYFTEDKTGMTSKLNLITYEISSEKKTDYNTITVYNFSKVLDIYSSPVINILYFDVETKSGDTTKDTIYRIDLFNSLSTYASSVKIENAFMMQTKDRLYYEDDDKNIYSSKTRLTIFKENVNLIGIDSDDNMYFLSINNDKAYKVSNNKIVDTIELKNKEVLDTYCNNKAVYLIYSDYVTKLSSVSPNEKIGKLSKYVTFMAIKEDTMYLKTPNNIVVTTELKEVTEQEDNSSIITTYEEDTTTTTDTTSSTTTTTNNNTTNTTTNNNAIKNNDNNTTKDEEDNTKQDDEQDDTENDDGRGDS